MTQSLGLRPAAGRVLLEPVVQEQTDGGLLLAANTEQKGHIFRVVAMGAYCEENLADRRPHGGALPLLLGVGDKVILGKYIGTEITWQGQDYLLARYAEILAYVL